jgi:hypothetical protein
VNAVQYYHTKDCKVGLIFATARFLCRCQLFVEALSQLKFADCITWAFVIFINSMREDVFKTLVTARDKFGDSLEPEAKRYLERLIKLGQRNGKSAQPLGI